LHSSLTVRSNLVTIGAAALVAAGTAMLPGPSPVVAWTLAAIFGVVAGITQALTLRAVPERFRAADSSVEVRRVLMSRTSGRLAVLAQWILVAVLIAVALSGAVSMAGALGGYAVFVGVRDVVALKAVVDLASGG
jgi:hypothetical protein